MNKPSERIVVFVSPAQKRAIAATAGELGISISELMRRAVLNFGATSEQVKAASIVDRLRAPREPDALNEALERVARTTKRMRQADHPALKAAVVHAADQQGMGAADAADAANSANAAHESVADKPLLPLLPIDPTVALSAVAAAGASVNVAVNVAVDADVAAQAAARVAAAKSAALKANADAAHDASNPCIDPTKGNGRFA